MDDQAGAGNVECLIVEIEDLKIIGHERECEAVARGRIDRKTLRRNIVHRERKLDPGRCRAAPTIGEGPAVVLRIALDHPAIGKADAKIDPGEASALRIGYEDMKGPVAVARRAGGEGGGDWARLGGEDHGARRASPIALGVEIDRAGREHEAEAAIGAELQNGDGVGAALQSIGADQRIGGCGARRGRRLCGRGEGAHRGEAERRQDRRLRHVVPPRSRISRRTASIGCARAASREARRRG